MDYYLPLESTASLCCKPRVESSTPIETIERLDTTIQAIDVRIKSIEYQCTQHTLKAKQFHAKKDDIRCRAELQMRHEKQQTYKRFVDLHSNICRIRHSIDSTQAFGEIATHMGLANKILEEALKQVNPEKIDDLMDQLSDNSIYVNEIGDALGREISDFDEDAALADLEDDFPMLPDVPQQQQQQEKTKKKKQPTLA